VLSSLDIEPSCGHRFDILLLAAMANPAAELAHAAAAQGRAHVLALALMGIKLQSHGS
jgi:hypothetical protein